MSAVVSTIDIARPPAEVYAYMTDPTRFAEWQRDVVRVEADGPLGLGDRFATTRRVGGSERTMTQEVRRADAPTVWVARGVDGPIRPNAAVAIEPLGDGSRVTLTLDFDGRWLAAPLVPMVRRMAARATPVSLANLKHNLETSA